MKSLSLITIDPAICNGQACIKGSRIPMSVVLDDLAAGRSNREILDEYPTLTQEDIRAAIGYAAELITHSVADATFGSIQARQPVTEEEVRQAFAEHAATRDERTKCS